ncbi:beta-ketoacyl synthase N-terminal-like domain-containing protein [Mycobacterium spongiae]|nr:beta-ketoacyl synthase N-terminal-like domain-containing protein [Mycobacterium spongiae]
MSDVAVAGMSCRFPRAAGPAGLWTLLGDGVDAVGPMPASRLPGNHQPLRPPGAADDSQAHGDAGYLDDISEFNASFFNISPREAKLTDPRQRLARELAWELFHGAHIIPAVASERRIGVFIGAMNDSYGLPLQRDLDNLRERHRFTGVARSIIANRVSRFMNFGGSLVWPMWGGRWFLGQNLVIAVWWWVRRVRS